MVASTAVENRFWGRVKQVKPNLASRQALRNYGKDPTARCWVWKGYLSPQGYGVFHAQNRHFMAHRFAYELLIGPIPDGMVLDHLCRTRNCVNPEHSEPVDNLENIQRGGVGWRKGISWRLKLGVECQRLRKEYGREPTPEELASTMDNDVEKVEEILQSRQLDLDLRKIEAGNYRSRLYPFRVFRSGNSWCLEIDSDVVGEIFETRCEAIDAAREYIASGTSQIND